MHPRDVFESCETVRVVFSLESSRVHILQRNTVGSPQDTADYILQMLMFYHGQQMTGLLIIYTAATSSIYKTIHTHVIRCLLKSYASTYAHPRKSFVAAVRNGDLHGLHRKCCR